MLGSFYNDSIWTKVWDYSTPSSAPTPAVSVATGVSPMETQYSLYGHPIPLSVFGVGRIGGDIIAGPWIENGLASFIISFGVPADPSGTRTLREIAFDSEVVWDSTSGFSTESFTYRFYGGTLSQSADALETSHFGADAVAYRPQILLAFENLPLANTKFKKIPYVSAVIADSSGDDVNLGEAFERLAYSPWVGYTSDQFETVGITDGLVSGGLIIAEQAEFLATIQQFGRFYPKWSILQTDKLRIVDRGDDISADVVLTRARMKDKVIINRSEPNTVPRILELSTIDPDADYTIVPSRSQSPRDPVAVTSSVRTDTAYLPAIMDAATRIALVTYARNHEDRARKTISLTAMTYGLELEPGDFVGVTDLGADFPGGETFRVLKTLHGANYSVELTAESILQCDVTALTDPPVPPSGGSGFISASSTPYATATTIDQTIPICIADDLLVAFVMHGDTVTPPAGGWSLIATITATTPITASGTHRLSAYSRVALAAETGTTTTWTQATSNLFSVHIISVRGVTATPVVFDTSTRKYDNAINNTVLTAVSTATASGQVALIFGTSAYANSPAIFPTTHLSFGVSGGVQTTDYNVASNRLCGGYLDLDAGADTAGVMSTDQGFAGGGWALITVLLG